MDLYKRRRRFMLVSLSLAVLINCCHGSRESDSSNEDDALKQALILVELLKAEYVKAVQENNQLRQALATVNVNSSTRAVPVYPSSQTPQNEESQQPDVPNTNLETSTPSSQTTIQDMTSETALQENDQSNQQDDTTSESTTTSASQKLSTDVASLAEYIRILQEKNVLDEELTFMTASSSTKTPQSSTSVVTSGQVGESSTSSISSSTSQTTGPTQSDAQIPFYGNYRRNLPADVAWSKEMLTDFRRKLVKATPTTLGDSDKSLKKSRPPKQSKNSLTESNDKPKKKKSNSVAAQVRQAIRKSKKKHEKSSSRKAMGRTIRTTKRTRKATTETKNKQSDKKEETDPIMDQVRAEIRRELGTSGSNEQLKGANKPLNSDTNQTHANATTPSNTNTTIHEGTSKTPTISTPHTKNSTSKKNSNATTTTRITPRSTYKIFLGKSTKMQIPLPENNAFCYYYPKSPLCGTFIGK